MKKVIHNPHDKFFRQSMADPRVAKAFFEQHLPVTIQAVADLNHLQPQKDSFIDEQLRLAITDMLFATTFKGHPGYLYLAVEHQSKPDKLMPFRLLKYTIAIMEQHLKTTQSSQLPLVYPMVFYTGQTIYPYSTDIFDLFDDPTGLAPQVLFKPFQLIDVSQIPDERLKQHVWLGILELCMKHIFARDILPYLQDMLDLFKQAEQAGGNTYTQTALTYLLTAGEVSDKATFFEAVQRRLSPETGASIMTLAQQLQAEGMEKGIEKGKIEGRLEGELEAKKAIAQKLLKQGLSLEAISQITELSLQEIQALGKSSASSH